MTTRYIFLPDKELSRQGEGANTGIKPVKERCVR